MFWFKLYNSFFGKKATLYSTPMKLGYRTTVSVETFRLRLLPERGRHEGSGGLGGLFDFS